MTQPDSKPNPKEKQLLDLAGRTPSEGGLDPLEFAQLFPDWQLVEALRREGIVLVGSIRNKASGDEKILRFLTGSLGDAAHAEAVANFRHALIPELVEWATDGGQFYEIRNPCDGDPLAAAIDSGAVTTADVLPAIRGVVDEAAASGVNLRIAPEDVFVGNDGRLTLLPRLAVETEPPASLPDFPGWPAWGSLVGSSIGDAVLANGSQPDPLEGSELGIGGRYKILQRIGEGGFATVYMAEQTVPVRRRVAVKILKAGMDTRQIIARFEAERQALAMMNHPNIAKIFDGGESGLGLPFFAMELVRGTPITDYCDREALDTKSRLRLFLQVCGAVQHAHQKGIIHRDLKPGNVLVTVRDGADPVPKVIDFGVAKALEADLTEKTLFTRFEQVIGTPTYMSPEQAGVDAATGDIDTRADIYALGVLLYELLTGTTPFEAATLQRAAFDELRRILREEEAPRPSINLSSIGMDRRTEIASNRGIEVGGLCKLLRGDIDWIVMKAIEKDRRRRYETANALALDVKRHLENEPVSAGPPTLAYRGRKFFRKHRVAVGIATVVLLSIVGGLALAILGLGKAQDEATRALAAEALARSRLGKIEQERAQKEHARQMVEEQRNQALWNAYVARQFPIMAAWRNRDIGRLDGLLEELVPSPGQPDFRGWEWYYYRDQCARTFTVIPGRFPVWRPHHHEVAVVNKKSEMETDVELRSAEDGALRQVLATIPTSPDERVVRSRWSADGSRLAYLTNFGNVVVLDAKTRMPIFSKELDKDLGENDRFLGLLTLDLSRDGKWLATGWWNGRILLWNVDAGEMAMVLHEPHGHQQLERIRFSPTADVLAGALRHGKRTSWDISTGESFDYQRVCNKPGKVAWSPSGNRFAATNASSFSVYELGKASPVATHPHKQINLVAWISDTEIVSSGFDQRLRIWTVGSSQPPIEHRLTRATLWNLGASSDGGFLAMEIEEKIRIVKVGEPVPPATIFAPEVPAPGWLHWLAWGEHGRLIVSAHRQNGGAGGKGSTVRIWDVEDEELVQVGRTPSLRSLSWNQDYTEILGSTDSCQFIRIPVGKSGEPKSRDLPRRNLSISISGSSPDGAALLFGTEKQIFLIDTADLTTRAHLPILSVVTAVRWNQDGCRVAVSDWNHLHVLNSATGEVIAKNSMGGKLQGLTWDPTDRFLAMASEDGLIQIASATALDEVAVLHGHVGAVNDVDWAAHGRIASAGEDGTIRLWDATTFREVLSIDHPEGVPFRSVRWSPDGRRLAAGDVQGRVFVWGSPKIQPVPMVARGPETGEEVDGPEGD